MGLCFKFQYRNNPTISIQTPQNNNKRALVRHQPYSTLRPAHPLCPRGFPGKDRKPPHLNCQAPQPPHGTTVTLSDHQASKTTMEI